MWRKCLISLGIVVIVLTACGPQLLIAQPDPSDYQVVALIVDAQDRFIDLDGDDLALPGHAGTAASRRTTPE